MQRSMQRWMRMGLLPLAAVAALAVQQAATLTVTQATLGTGIQDHHLTGEAASFTAGTQVYLWLEVTGGPSDPITVTWKRGDTTALAYKLDIQGSPWHTWANKNVTAGDWTVNVSDAAGQELKSLSFTVQ